MMIRVPSILNRSLAQRSNLPKNHLAPFVLNAVDKPDPKATSTLMGE